MIARTRTEVYGELLQFLDRLSAASIPYDLSSVRPEALMVQFATPGVRWEVEFMEDRSVEVERFYSDGRIEDESALHDLWQSVAADAEA